MSKHPEQVVRSASFVPAISFELILGLSAVVLGLVVGPNARGLIPQFDQWQEIAFGVAAGAAATLPLLLVMLILSYLPLKSVRDIKHHNRNQLAPFFASLTVPQILVFCLATGICEELLFRGWMQMFFTGELDPISPWNANAVWGLLAASVGFGLCHYVSPFYAIVATLTGVYLGVLLIETQNLLVPITAHTIYDAVMLGLLIREHRKDGP